MRAGCLVTGGNALPPGGAIAIITHGIPLWLADTEWSRAVNAYLTGWFGRLGAGSCGTDETALREGREQLTTTGFDDAAVLEHHDRADVDADYVIGHLYSALSEDVRVTALVGRR